MRVPWVKDSGDALVALRWAIIILAPVMLMLSGDVDAVTLSILGGFIIYTLWVNRVIRSLGRVPLAAIIVDLAIVSALIYVRDPVVTDAHLFYYLVIIMAGMSFGMKGSLVTCGAAMLLYYGAAMLAGAPPEFVGRIALRSIYFLLFAFLSGFLAYMEQRQREAAASREGALDALQQAHRKLAAQAEAAQKMAYRDPLTGLPNRRYLYEELERRLASPADRQGLALMFIDMDRFKRVNDALGHHVGDGLLSEIAVRLKEVLGDGPLIARLAGDEFAVILPDVESDEEVARLAEKLLEALKAPCRVMLHELYVTASIGIAVADKETDPATLLKRADAAMFRGVKAQGRNSYGFYTSALERADRERLAMSNDLSQALESGQLNLQYQPQLNLTTGSVDSLEALLRWRRPGGELVQPASFIEIAEESGLILPIGAWVLQEVCRQLRQWRDAGSSGFSVAVNISAYQFHLQRLPELVEEALNEHNLEPALLTFELAETAMLQHTEEVRTRLRRLKEMDVQVALDDFGMGYSSLSYLRRLPVDIIKLDRAFVRDLTRSRRDVTIASSVIELAHALGLWVVAEGVEDAAAMEHLRSLGCDAIQGYVFSRPLPAGQVPGFLKQVGQAVQGGGGG